MRDWQAFVRALPEDGNIRILDLCCGTGDQLRAFERAGYVELRGLDLDPGMLAVAKRRSGTIPFDEGDAARTPYPDASFDIVILSLALHDKEQSLREAILTEAGRLLKPEAYILAADFAFDERTRFMGRFLITAVERFAGGEHYENFKDYIRRGGMKNILPRGVFDIEETARVLNAGIALWKIKRRR